MKKLKINKKVITTSIYTIALLLAISFAIYPKTNSLFLKNKERALAYTSNLDNINNGIIKTTLSDESDINNIKIIVDLKRDTRYTGEGNTDEYTLEIKNVYDENATCKIVPNSTEGITITNDKITFNGNNTTGKVTIECDVRDNIKNKENINIDIKMYERINDEKRISYGKVTHTETYIDYFNKYGNIIYINKTEDSVLKPKDDTEVYNEFIELLKKHYDILASNPNEYVNKHNIDKNAFVQYAYDQFDKTLNDKNEIIGINAKDVLFDSNPFPIMGVTRTEVKDTNNNVIGYAYTFEESLTGYVKTHEWYKDYGTEADANHIYFSTTNSDLIKEEVKNVLEKYTYKNELSKAKEITDYINSYINDKFSGLYSMENLNKIPGVKYIASGNVTGDKYPFINLDISISDIAYNYMSNKKPGNTKIFKISHYDILDYESIMEKVFSYALGEAYNENGDAIYDRIEIDGALDTAIICKENCVDYEEVYYNYIDNKYYTIKITHKDGYNEITTSKSDTSPITGSAKLNEAIICQKNCSYNHEVHLSNGIYSEYKISQYNNVGNRIIVTKSNNNPITGSQAFNDWIKDNKRYAELQYDGENYYQVSVTPSDTNNPLIITLDNIGTEIHPNYGGSQLLEKAIKCKENCEEYNELRYRNGKYTLMTVVHNGEKSIVVTGNSDANAKNAFINSLKYNVESINLSLSDTTLLGQIKDVTSVYNEMHYDNGSYLLVKVKAYNNQKIITVSKLWTPSGTAAVENQNTLDMMIADVKNGDNEYTYHLSKTENLAEKLDGYLESHFNIERYQWTNEALPGGIYSTGDYELSLKN